MEQKVELEEPLTFAQKIKVLFIFIILLAIMMNLASVFFDNFCSSPLNDTTITFKVMDSKTNQALSAVFISQREIENLFFSEKRAFIPLRGHYIPELNKSKISDSLINELNRKIEFNYRKIKYPTNILVCSPNQEWLFQSVSREPLLNTAPNTPFFFKSRFFYLLKKQKEFLFLKDLDSQILAYTSKDGLVTYSGSSHARRIYWGFPRIIEPGNFSYEAFYFKKEGYKTQQINLPEYSGAHHYLEVLLEPESTSTTSTSIQED
jgi:hypothetical protein